METTVKTQTSRELLIASGFHRSPNTYFCCFDGKFYPEFERWSAQVTEPKTESIKRYEGIEATEFGFTMIFDHGKLCPFSVLHFPKWATEDNYDGAFARMVAFIKANYVWEGGLPAGIWGD